ncbi:MAG: HAD family hydrolase [candidate division SR1 bacterium]|nr:HAD family hydrolase [candidate division SR1 bacterium]
MKEKKLIAFDLYDTCFEFTLPGANLSYKKLFTDLGVLNKRHELKKILITSCRNIEDILSDICPDTKFQKHLENYYDNIKSEIDSVQLFPETVSVLSELKNRGHKIAAISNISQPYIKSLNILLPNTFNYEVLSCNVGVSKPDKRIFDCLKNISGYQADEMIMVGDNLYSDIQGAKNANIDPIHIDRFSQGIKKYKEYTSISNLEQLLDIL